MPRKKRGRGTGAWDKAKKLVAIIGGTPGAARKLLSEDPLALEKARENPPATLVSDPVLVKKNLRGPGKRRRRHLGPRITAKRTKTMVNLASLFLGQRLLASCDGNIAEAREVLNAAQQLQAATL